MKDQGLKATYPLSYDQTYTAMRTALVWLLVGSRANIEEHKEQGCLLVGGGGDSRGYCIIWLDSLGEASTRVALLTDGITGEYYKETKKLPTSIEKIRDNMDYAAQLLKDGKPLPIRR